MKQDLEKMDIEKVIKIVPPVIGVVFVLGMAAVHQDAGTTGVSILFSMMMSAAPYIIWKYIRVNKIKGMEDQFPNFLRDLVEAKKSGMTLPEALRDVSQNEYGELNTEVDKMNKQLSWGMSFDEVMIGFKERVDESNLMKRSIYIIMEAKRSGGNIISAMETVASDVTTIMELEKDRKSEMSKHAAVMYIIYFMFMAITLILSEILVPMTQIDDGGGFLMGGDGGGICIPPMQTSEEVLCSLFESFAGSFGLGAEGGAYYEGLFLSMVIVQGIFSGLVIGQIRSNSAIRGFKHSMIMMSVGMAGFILVSRYLAIEII